MQLSNMVGLTCFAISACVSCGTQTAVSIDQVRATSAIMTSIWLALVNIYEQILLNMNCVNNLYLCLKCAYLKISVTRRVIGHHVITVHCYAMIYA